MSASQAIPGLMSLLASTIALAGGGSSGAGVGDRLVLATYWGDDRIALIDTEGEAGKEEVWTIDTLQKGGCAKPYDIRVDRKGLKAYASCSGNDQVIVIDIVAQLIEKRIQVGSSPRDLQLFDNDQRLIVANSGSDSVSVVDIPNAKVLYEVPVTAQPYGVAITKAGAKNIALVTGWASGDLHILDLTDTGGSERSKVGVGFLPYTVVMPSDGSVAYVASNGTHSVSVVDVKSSKLLGNVKVGTNPWSIALNEGTGQLLVTNNRSNSLSLLQFNKDNKTALPSVKATNSAGEDDRYGHPLKRAAKNTVMSRDGKKGVFTDLANNEVVVMSLPDGQLTKIIQVGKAPYGIEFIR